MSKKRLSNERAWWVILSQIAIYIVCVCVCVSVNVCVSICDHHQRVALWHVLEYIVPSSAFFAV